MNFFYLTKSDRKVIILLLCVIAAALAVITITGSREEETALEPMVPEQAKQQRLAHGSYDRRYERKPQLAPFDPNSADSAQLRRLGLKPWQIDNLYKYRAAGGVFRKPSDFARLYGLSRQQYRQLEPYIRISQADTTAANQLYAYNPIEQRDTLRYPVKLQPEERVVLNLADTTALRKVPGIGSHFARKIVEYRRRLGGYYSVQQLLEIEDFPETAVAFFIIPDSTLPQHRLNINRLSLSELKRHPYISFFQARTITDYRRLHGRIDSLQQLKLSRDFPPEAISRLEPYIEY